MFKFSLKSFARGSHDYTHDNSTFDTRYQTYDKRNRNDSR